MELPKTGMDRDAITKQLAEYHSADLSGRMKHIYAYSYTPGKAVDDISKEAYMEFLHTSALDPTTYPSVLRLEKEVVSMIKNLLRGDEEVVGNMTFGGTESILLAIKTARDYMRDKHPEITEPEIIIPQTAHPAHHKACQYFNIKAVLSPFDPVTFKADAEAMRKLITPNTIMLVGSACSYAQGVIDPIRDIAGMAKENGLLCHVDGCVGGIHFSLMRRMGYDLPDFDFTVPGVTSISADMHKYGLAPKNASVILQKNKELRRYQIYSCNITTTYALINPSVLSTKSGGPMAASWATLMALGEEGYGAIIKDLMGQVKTLVDGVNAIPELRVLGEPQMCMFSFASDELNIFQLQTALLKRGYYTQPQFSTENSPPNLHLTLSPSGKGHETQFLAALKEAVEEVKAGDKIDPEIVKAQVNAMIEEHGDSAIDQLRAMAGVAGSDLPDDMALPNTLLDALPKHMSNELLIDFMNDIHS